MKYSSVGRGYCWMNVTSIQQYLMCLLYLAFAALEVLFVDFRFDELREFQQRFLPSERAGFDGNDIGNTLLDHAQLGADDDGFQRDSHGHLARKVRVVKHVRVHQLFAGNECPVYTAE